MSTLVHDEHLASKTLVAGLRARGFSVKTLHELGLNRELDPDVVRQIPNKLEAGEDWVLVTIDYTIIDDHSGFEWERYAIAWIVLDKYMRGGEVEALKHDIVHKHPEKIAAQGPDDHFSYTRRSQFKHPPNLISRPY